jgi:hypothetical protein
MMLRSGDKMRFTPTEIGRFREMGVDLQDVKSRSDCGDALLPWIDGLAEVRPDLLERMVRELAEVKGVNPPPRLNVVPSADSPGQS